MLTHIPVFHGDYGSLAEAAEQMRKNHRKRVDEVFLAPQPKIKRGLKVYPIYQHFSAMYHRSSVYILMSFMDIVIGRLEIRPYIIESFYTDDGEVFIKLKDIDSEYYNSRCFSLTP